MEVDVIPSRSPAANRPETASAFAAESPRSTTREESSVPLSKSWLKAPSRHSEPVRLPQSIRKRASASGGESPRVYNSRGIFPPAVEILAQGPPHVIPSRSPAANRPKNRVGVRCPIPRGVQLARNLPSRRRNPGPSPLTSFRAGPPTSKHPINSVGVRWRIPQGLQLARNLPSRRRIPAHGPLKSFRAGRLRQPSAPRQRSLPDHPRPTTREESFLPPSKSWPKPPHVIPTRSAYLKASEKERRRSAANPSRSTTREESTLPPSKSWLKPGTTD